MPPAAKRKMPARKCRRTCAPPVPELPACLLLEIAARTDAATIFRCAATCKLFRREIMSTGFLRRVCQGPGAVVPSRTLGALGETFSVVHPRTVATAALERDYLSPYMSRRGSIAAAGLLEQYEHQTSRNGLVVLRRRRIDGRRRSERQSDLCVYDPMTNSRVFLPLAPDIKRDPKDRLFGFGIIDDCALLTAADGIGRSFMLLAADMARNLADGTTARIRVQTVPSSESDACSGGAQWSPVKTTDDHPCPWWCMSLDSHEDAAVVVGGVVHWLMHARGAWLLSDDDVGEHILTYDVDAAAVGSVDIPKGRQRAGDGSRYPLSQLASSPDGKLSFVATHQRTVSIWVLSSGGSWARHVEIDMMAECGPLPELMKPWMDMDHRLESFGDQRSGAVFVRIGGLRFVLDMETGAMCSTRFGGETGIPYEVDLSCRLASMKSF